MSVLETDGLSYMYDDKIVLDEVSVSVGKGEILGILGPNGCGKTTLLKNLNRNLHPHGGCVTIDGTDLEDITKRSIAQKVAVVPQTNEIRFAFTIRDIVKMGRMPFQEAFRGESSADLEIVEKAMERTGLLPLADRFINTVSGGERQRAIIARAIAQTPEVILMDEPTLHLDVNMQFEVLDLVSSLAKESALTVVIVSHDLPMVTRYCDRVILIHDRRVFAVGSPEEILTPENMRTVFKVDAELERDSRTGRSTVRLFGSCRV
ncbi:MAG: ABC transporter ATP-binding protein [Candidatus Methanoplasma sp.]|nr:ABC transporter ATP-binding protein [Candidatus Methanoplasma sp.]